MLLTNLILNPINVSNMKFKKVIKWIKLVLKFLIPIVVGWIEGDTHAIADGISSLLTSLF